MIQARLVSHNVLVSSRSLGGSHNSFDIEQQSEKTNLGLRPSFIHVCLHFRLRFWQRGGKFKSLIILLIVDSPT